MGDHIMYNQKLMTWPMKALLQREASIEKAERKVINFSCFKIRRKGRRLLEEGNNGPVIPGSWQTEVPMLDADQVSANVYVGTDHPIIKQMPPSRQGIPKGSLVVDGISSLDSRNAGTGKYNNTQLS